MTDDLEQLAAQILETAAVLGPMQLSPQDLHLHCEADERGVRTWRARLGMSETHGVTARDAAERLLGELRAALRTQALRLHDLHARTAALVAKIEAHSPTHPTASAATVVEGTWISIGPFDPRCQCALDAFRASGLSARGVFFFVDAHEMRASFTDERGAFDLRAAMPLALEDVAIWARHLLADVAAKLDRKATR